MFKRTKSTQDPATGHDAHSVKSSSSTASLHHDDSPTRTKSIASQGSAGAGALSRILTSRGTRSRTKSQPSPSSPVVEDAQPPPLPRYSERQIILPPSSSDEDDTTAFLPAKLKQALAIGPAPPPALPDELLVALAQEPGAPISSTSRTTLPSLPTYSPLQMPSPQHTVKLKQHSSKSSLRAITTRPSPSASTTQLANGGLGISAITFEPKMEANRIGSRENLADDGRRHSLAVDRSPKQSSKRRASMSTPPQPSPSLGIEDELEVVDGRLGPGFELIKTRSNTSIYHDANEDDAEEEVAAAWQARESFTHDLIQRRRFLRRTRSTGKAKAGMQATPLEDEIEAATDSDESDADVSDVDEGEDTVHHLASRSPLRAPPSTATMRAPNLVETGMRARMAIRRERSNGSTSQDASQIRIPADLVPTRTPSADAPAPRTAPLPPSYRFGSNRPSPLSTPSKEIDDPLALRNRSMSDGALATTGPPVNGLPARNKAATLTDEAELASLTGLMAGKPAKPLQKSPPGRSRSGSLLKEALTAVATGKSKPEIVIAVVGSKGVGKSTIISRGLRKQANQTVMLEDDAQNKVVSYQTTFTVSGVPRSVEILEVDAAILRYTAEGLAWPASLPALDGAMLCYDATDKDALPVLKRMLNGFWTRGGMTLIVLATKSKAEDALNRINPNKAAEVANVYGAGTVQLDGGIEDEGRKMRNSFHWIVRAILMAKGEMSPSDRSSRPGTSLSMASSFAPASPPRRRATESSPTRRSLQSPTSPLVSPTKGVHEAPMDPAQASYLFPSPSTKSVEPLRAGTPPPKSIKYASSTAATDLSVSIEGLVPPLPLQQKPQELDTLLPKDEIIDKFLFASVTGNDEQFVTFFLIIFRRFARPFEVLSKLLERYDYVTTRLKSDPVLSRYAHMRLCGALAQWLETYPSDFVAPPTYALLKPFLENLILSSWVAHYAVEMLPTLKLISERTTAEGSWVLPDTDDSAAGLMSRKQSLAPSLASSAAPSSKKRLSALMDEGEASSTGLSLRGRSVSDAGTSNTADSSERTSGTGGSQVAFGRKLARDKSHGHSFSLLDYSNVIGEAPEDAIAIQITRLTWDIFAEIKPRDLLSYVMTPRDAKNPAQAPQRDESNPVARSIRLVNFLSDWVATLILVQNKLKHRVRLLEKFITIAIALREMENFDALMGVLAGLNSQPVFRLDATLELIKPKPVYKRFRSLNRLMASSKGFSAYRMALSTSSATMIPYLGCHLQDITRVVEGKSDMRNGLVNWSKFSQLAKCASIVVDCGRVAPAMPVEPQVERLIIGVPVLSLDDESLYALSYAIQPRGHRSKLRKLLDAVNSSVTPSHEMPRSS